LTMQFSKFGINWVLQYNKIVVNKSLIGSFYLSSTSTTTAGLNNKSGSSSIFSSV